MEKEEKEVIKKPKRFVCVQLEGSDKVTVIDVCDFLRRANNNGANSRLDYADALLKSAKYFNNMQEANDYMAGVLSTDHTPDYVGTEHIVCKEGDECQFLIHAINRITDNYSIHEIEYAVFSAEVDINGQLVFPLFLHFEKTKSLLNVTKVENKKEYTDNDLNKLTLLQIDSNKNDLFKKIPRPEREPLKRETIRYEQEMDR